MELLDRSRQHVALTDGGRVFLQQAKDFLARVEHAGRLAKRAADGRAGVLTVGTFPSADVRILPALRLLVAERLPDLRLVLHSKYAVDSVAGLRSGALDVAFVRGPLEAEGLEALEILREQLVIVLPSHHPLARRKRIPVDCLDDLPCITMERALSPALHDAALDLYREAKIRMQAVSRADNLLGHLRLVQEGLGFALLPDSIGALLPPGVTARPLECAPVPAVSVQIAWKSRNSSRLVSEFVELVRRGSSAWQDAPRLTRRPTKS